MQQLQGKLKNTPRSVQLFLAPCSVSAPLNKVERPSAARKVRTCNNPEGTQPEYTQELKANYVYVVSIEGKPLMPCKPAKAKKLLRSKKANVIKRYPFTIQLNFKCENQVQEVKLGIDSGYENIGFSAITDTKELIAGIVKLDGRTSKRLIERSMYRSNRRSRHHWYREARFNNRRKKEGWLPPSIQRRYDTHLNIIRRLKKILPISELTIEIANFDIQKIINPEIKGIEYQQGSLYEYQNTKSYLMAREKGKCQLCGKDFKGQPAHIHHCKQRSETGSNQPSNLALLHKACHVKLHQKGLKVSKPKSYKPNTFMSIIHKRFYLDIHNFKTTYGYITFIKRKELSLEKSHTTDAFIIAGGTHQERKLPWSIEQKHRHNRSIQLNRKGFKPSIRTSIYKIHPKDLIWTAGRQFTVVGVNSLGRYVKVKETKKQIPTRKIDKIYMFGGFAWSICS